MSITPPSSIPVSIDYTGRDYYSIRNDLIARVQARIPNWTASDPSDFGVALVEAFAYMGDLMNYYIDRSANESYLATAVQRQSVLNIAANYGYIPASYRSASCTIMFTNTSSNIVTVYAGTVVSGQVVIGDTTTTVFFTTLADAVMSAGSVGSPQTASVLAIHGESITQVDPINSDVNYGELIGTSDGTPGQAYQLGQSPVQDGSVNVYVQDGDVYVKWTPVQYLLDFGPNDLVFSTSVDANDIVTVNFGDGISGAIPNLHEQVRAVYTVGGGSIGNIPAGTIDTITYVPTLTSSQTTALQSYITPSNPEAAVGGSDPESTDQIRVAAPLVLRTNNRAVTLTDYASLAVSVNNVSKANAQASVFTSVTLYIAPTRLATDTDVAPGLDGTGSTQNGNPTLEFTTMEAAVTSFISDKLLLGTTVTIQPPTYVDANITIQYSKLPQYTDAEVQAALMSQLLTVYGYNGMFFQDTIYPQDIEAVLRQVNGVSTVQVTDLYRYGGSAARDTLVGAANEIFRFQEANVSIASL